MHAAPDTVRRRSPQHSFALLAGAKEDELRLAPSSHCDERGGQLLGVRMIVERAYRDDGRETGETGEADQRPGGRWV
jgi:hypothetical protein